MSAYMHLYYKISGVRVCVCWTDVTSPCLHRSYSCGTVSPACNVWSRQLHVYIYRRALVRESPEARETPWRANADAMREARARESREEGETRRRANADAMREARARESREEGETRWRANADAMREARARESREEGETRRRANADAMREARARESREEGETRRRANADAMREARARESREEGETRRRANTMREARAKRIADCGWSHICPLAFRKHCCSRPNIHTKVAEVSEATCNTYKHFVRFRYCPGNQSVLSFNYFTCTCTPRECSQQCTRVP